MTSRTRAAALGAGAVVLLLGAVCVPPAGAGTGDVAATAPADDGNTPAEGLVLTPDSAGPGARVVVRADCATSARGGTVFFLRVRLPGAAAAAGGASRAVATVADGLRPGSRHVVTANCSRTESLTSSFVVTRDRPSGPVDAGYGGLVAGEAAGARRARQRRDAGVGNAALAFGGGLATAALAGYVLTLRANSARQRARTRRR